MIGYYLEITPSVSESLVGAIMVGACKVLKSARVWTLSEPAPNAGPGVGRRFLPRFDLCQIAISCELVSSAYGQRVAVLLSGLTGIFSCSRVSLGGAGEPASSLLEKIRKNPCDLLAVFDQGQTPRYSHMADTYLERLAESEVP